MITTMVINVLKIFDIVYVMTGGNYGTEVIANRLYTDIQRGDAGIRVRREILFQLDLSMRRRDGLQRVMVMGSDPLRGFNDTGVATDFTAQDVPKPGENLVPWNAAGIQLFDKI